MWENSLISICLGAFPKVVCALKAEGVCYKLNEVGNDINKLPTFSYWFLEGVFLVLIGPIWNGPIWICDWNINYTSLWLYGYQSCCYCCYVVSSLNNEILCLITFCVLLKHPFICFSIQSIQFSAVLPGNCFWNMCMCKSLFSDPFLICNYSYVVFHGIFTSFEKIFKNNVT